ncbi:MAG: PIG-L deacetylase family protein [bacterium]
MSIKQTVLALCAHPDDAEIFCGGTLIQLAEKGWDVHIATLTSGDCGSAEEPAQVIAARRVAEAKSAAELIGGAYHCLGGQDLQVYDNQQMRSNSIALLREVNPDVVITHYPVDYMPDHDAASALARTAVFTAPIPNYTVGKAAYFPAMQKMAHLYYFGSPLGGTDYLGNPICPQFIIDITDQMEQKKSMLACHASQRDWLRRQHGIDQYIDEMREWNEKTGQLVSKKYAEGFNQHLGHAYPHSPLLQDLLSAVFLSKE